MAKTAQSQSNPNLTKPEANEAKESLRTQPTEEEIAVRAYHLYLERDGAEGDPVDDWLQAERELAENR